MLDLTLLLADVRSSECTVVADAGGEGAMGEFQLADEIIEATVEAVSAVSAPNGVSIRLPSASAYTQRAKAAPTPDPTLARYRGM